MEKKEKIVNAFNGYVMFGVLFALQVLAVFISVVVTNNPALALVAAGLILFCGRGFAIINPNKAIVLVLFGKYSGTVTTNGLVWVNPFMTKRMVSLRARNLNSEAIKVNDKMGNPIMISAVLVWRINDTFRAVFDVDDYHRFVDVQSEAAIRSLAAAYCYDSFESHEEGEITLRSGGQEVNEVLEGSLRDRLAIAGVEVMEARISNLAYAPEIAGAMLQRQQATAVVAARHKIVQGAVWMVEMALDMLAEKNIVDLDEEKKAAMVSNLLVVLTSDHSVSPVVNTGTLNH